MAKIRTMIIDNDIDATTFISNGIHNDNSFELLCIEQNSRVAISKIFDFNPDVIFLCIEMPHICAFELINILKIRCIKSRIVLLAPNDCYASKAIKANVFDYFIKPIKLEDLHNCLSRMVLLDQLRYNQFTVNEHRIIDEIMLGNNIEDISNNLNIATSTVSYHKNNIFKKVGVKNTVEFIYQMSNTPEIILK